MRPMTRFYATTDFDYKIREDADIQVFGSLEEVEDFFKQAYSLDEGERLEIGEGEFSDCWLKVRDFDAEDIFIYAPFERDEISVLYPGNHPGLPRYSWITPRPTVLVPYIVSALD